jgi:hypothetical protein
MNTPAGGTVEQSDDEIRVDARPGIRWAPEFQLHQLLLCVLHRAGNDDGEAA